MKIKIENLDLVHKTRVEIFPLIDVIFLLLVFFIYSMLSMTVNRGIDVVLPTAATSTENKKDDYHCISVNTDGEIFYNKKQFSLIELKPKIVSLVAKDKDSVVFIQGDKDSRYSVIMSVLDMVRGTGLKKVFLVAKHEEEQQQGNKQV